MHVVLASIGSLGDVHPFIALGRALLRRGHRVSLICNEDFRPLVEGHGLTFASAGAAVNLPAATANPLLWHPIKGLGVFWRHMLAPAIEPTFRQIERLAADGPCVVVATPTMFGARFARERLGVRLISAITAPAVLRTDAAPLTMAHWRLPRGTPTALVRLAWRALDRYKLHPMASATLRSLAERLGSDSPAAGSSVFGDWMVSPDGALTLFPAWFAARRGGWPRTLRFGDFPLDDAPRDEPSSAALPDHVERFLQAGDPPLVFMPGTAMRHAAPFFEAAVGACAGLHQRAILLTADRDQVPAELPGGILHAPYLPFGQLLPRARALVHHGGIGSCSQALRAGIPQLLMPMAHDQFDNAECLRRLGVGLVLRPREFQVARLADTLARLQALPAAPRLSCSERLQRPGRLHLLCDAIEAMAHR